MRKLVNHRISVTVNRENYESFENVYPNCLSKFIRNCIKNAIVNRDFFQNVYFDEDFEIVNKLQNLSEV